MKKDDHVCEEARETLQQIKQQVTLLRSAIAETRQRIEASRAILAASRAENRRSSARTTFVAPH